MSFSEQWPTMGNETSSYLTELGSTVITEAYWSAVSGAGADNSPDDNQAGITNPTYLKLYHGHYEHVYRLPYPSHGPVTLDYILRHLPQLNFSKKITRNGDEPAATNG